MTIGGVRTDQECEMFRRRHVYENSSMQTVITTTSHKARRDEAQLRVVTHEYADAMRVPEHHASTLRTRTLKSAISRIMSKCRTRQLESCNALSAFFHAWLDRGVRMKPPKDPRLSNGWRWQLEHSFLLSPGVCTQWSPGGVHVRCVENLASLPEVKGLKSSSRVAGRGQCGVLKTSTATEIMVRREGKIIAPYLGPDGFVLLFATKELARDMQSMLSMLKLRQFAWYLSSAADVSPFFAYSGEPGTTLVWADADWSGNEMTCKSASAGAVQLEYYGIEAWRVVQQVVSFSSDENESYATEMSKADRWETLDHRWNQIRRSGAYPETRAEDVVEQTIQAVEKVPDTVDSINNEAKCKEKLLGARKALKSWTQKVAVAVAEFAFVSPREPPDKMSPGQDALENAKKCPSDLDTRVQAMPVVVTSRFATPWNTRTQWSCFGFICGLARNSQCE